MESKKQSVREKLADTSNCTLLAIVMSFTLVEVSFLLFFGDSQLSDYNIEADSYLLNAYYISCSFIYLLCMLVSWHGRVNYITVIFCIVMVVLITQNGYLSLDALSLYTDAYVQYIDGLIQIICSAILILVALICTILKLCSYALLSCQYRSLF